MQFTRRAAIGRRRCGAPAGAVRRYPPTPDPGIQPPRPDSPGYSPRDGRGEIEETARAWLLLIGSTLPRSRGWHVRAVFGIEDFSGKANGGRALGKRLHLEHRGLRSQANSPCTYQTGLAVSRP